MRKIFYPVIILLAGIISACHKNTPAPIITSDSPGSTLDFIKDSVYLYSKEAYYWADALPDYASLQPRTFAEAADVDALSDEVDYLSQYKINPATNLPY